MTLQPIKLNRIYDEIPSEVYYFLDKSNYFIKEYGYDYLYNILYYQYDVRLLVCYKDYIKFAYNKKYYDYQLR